MKDPQGSSEGTLPVCDQDTQSNEEKRRKHAGANPPGTSRRTFLGQVGIGGAAAVALAAIPFEPLIEGKHGEAEAAVVQYGSSRRARDSYDYRQDTARKEEIDVGEQPDNGDSQRFTDYSGNYSKCLQHQYLGIPVYSSYQSLLHALQTGRFSDFQNILVGNPGGTNSTAALNGPQGCLAFDLEASTPTLPSFHPRRV